MSDLNKTLSAEELGEKLLKAVQEMQAGQAARSTQVQPNEVATIRNQIGLSQKQFAHVL